MRYEPPGFVGESLPLGTSDKLYERDHLGTGGLFRCCSLPYRSFTRDNPFRMKLFYETYRDKAIVTPAVSQLPWTQPSHHSGAEQTPRRARILPSGVTSKAAIVGHSKTGQLDWPKT
jgi:hypothetical protein